MLSMELIRVVETLIDKEEEIDAIIEILNNSTQQNYEAESAALQEIVNITDKITQELDYQGLYLEFVIKTYIRHKKLDQLFPAIDFLVVNEIFTAQELEKFSQWYNIYGLKSAFSKEEAYCLLMDIMLEKTGLYGFYELFYKTEYREKIEQFKRDLIQKKGSR